MSNWPTNPSSRTSANSVHYGARKLGDICEIYQPQTITSNEILKEGPYKVFGANGVIGYYSKYNHESAEVLITCRGATCGTINISEPKSWVTGNAMVVHPKNEKILSKSFLYYALKHSNLHKTITGTGQPQITRNSLSPFKIILPPLEIQKQIVERLDKIAEAQKLNDELIQKSDELSQSLLHKELNPVGENWKVRKLGSVFDRITDAILPTKHPEQKFNFIGLENIESNTSRLVNISPVQGRFIKSTKTRFKIGDVLYGKLRPYLNKVWLADFNGICSTDIWALRAKEGIILPQLLGAILQQSSIVQKSSASMAGANLPRANKDIFDKITIVLPPLEIQKQIVAKLSAVQGYKKQLLGQRLKLKELFDSVLYKLMKNE